jgi:hypothetical protein
MMSPGTAWCTTRRGYLCQRAYVKGAAVAFSDFGSYLVELLEKASELELALV